MFELFLYKAARTFLESLNKDGRREVGRLLEIIRVDPYVDGRVKFDLAIMPIVFSMYRSPDYKICYRLTGNVTIRVYNIGYADQPVLPVDWNSDEAPEGAP